MHTGKELETHEVEKERLSCYRRKTNRRKTRPYCTLLAQCAIYKHYS